MVTYYHHRHHSLHYFSPLLFFPPNVSAPELGYCSGHWVPYNGHCYYLDRTPKSWRRAQRACRSEGGDIVSIHNVEEQSFVISQLGYGKLSSISKEILFMLCTMTIKVQVQDWQTCLNSNGHGTRSLWDLPLPQGSNAKNESLNKSRINAGSHFGSLFITIKQNKTEVLCCCKSNSCCLILLLSFSFNFKGTEWLSQCIQRFLKDVRHVKKTPFQHNAFH